MSQYDSDTRAQLGCIYEPVLVQATPWSPLSVNPEWRGIDDKGAAPTVCPGYSCSLPHVVEADRARVHWGKNALEAYCGGPPSETLVAFIEVLEAEHNQVERFVLEERQAAQQGGA